MKDIIPTITRHKTLYVVVFWLVLLALAMFALSTAEDLPILKDLLSMAGWASLSYVGVAKIANVVTAARSPKGEYGFEQQPFYSEQYWWIVAYWCILLFIMLVLRLVRQGSLYPLSDCLFFAGSLSIAYAGLNKGTHVAAAAGTSEKSDAGGGE